jgi:pSer/pThr/pTyr-binding forkhead associated (FHA) protein
MSEQTQDLIWNACGAVGEIQLDVALPGLMDFSKTCDLPFAIVGRHPDVDLVLADEQVSRRHAYLQLIGGRLFCADLSSRTGIQWDNGQTGSGWLDANRTAQIGPYCLRLAEHAPLNGSIAEADFNPVAVGGLDPSRFSDVILDFFKKSKKVLTWRLDRVLTLVGRSSRCKVRILDASVSPWHCSLLYTPEGVWVIDLGGPGGIKLNGQRVRWGRLDDGDELQIGQYLVRVRHEDRATGGGDDLGGPAEAEAAHTDETPVPQAPEEDQEEAAASAEAVETEEPAADAEWPPEDVTSSEPELEVPEPQLEAPEPELEASEEELAAAASEPMMESIAAQKEREEAAAPPPPVVFAPPPTPAPAKAPAPARAGNVFSQVMLILGLVVFSFGFGIIAARWAPFLRQKPAWMLIAGVVLMLVAYGTVLVRWLKQNLPTRTPVPPAAKGSAGGIRGRQKSPATAGRRA